MKTVRIPNGFLHINESLANCPECGKHVPIDEIDLAFSKTNKGIIAWSCDDKECREPFAITTDYKGDYVSFII